MDNHAYSVGDEVECRTAYGDWFRAVVTEGVHLVKYGKAWLPAVGITGASWTDVNWPAEDVRPWPSREVRDGT